MSAVMTIMSRECFVDLLQQPARFDRWLEKFKAHDAIGIRGGSGQSPIERWLDVSGYPARVYLDRSHNLFMSTPTPEWCRVLLESLEKTGAPRHPVFAWEVRRIRAAYQLNATLPPSSVLH